MTPTQQSLRLPRQQALPLPGLGLDVASPALGAAVTATFVPSFTRRLIVARAATDDGVSMVEFDIRPFFHSASDEDLQLLATEWFVGSGPGCRRVLERSSDDTQAFLGWAQARGQGWTLVVDAKRACTWIEEQRPHLTHMIDPELCLG